MIDISGQTYVIVKHRQFRSGNVESSNAETQIFRDINANFPRKITYHITIVDSEKFRAAIVSKRRSFKVEDTILIRKDNDDWFGEFS